MDSFRHLVTWNRAADGFSCVAIVLFFADLYFTRRSPSAATLDITLRLIAAIACFTFLSLASQAEGLSKLEPADPAAIDAWLANMQTRKPEIVCTLRAIRWGLARALATGPSGLRRWCLIGAALASAAALRPFAQLFAACYFMYLITKRALGAFLNLQFDALLLEALFFAVPLSLLGPGSAFAGLWLLRVVNFRLLFGSGVVKLASGDRTWRNLTANAYHFYTQPLPTCLARYLHFLPLSCHKLATFGALFIELVLPLVAFCGRRARIFCCMAYLDLQASIAAGGHYGHFSALSAVLALSLLDDDALRPLLAAWSPAAIVAAIGAFFGIAALGGVPAALAVAAATTVVLQQGTPLPWLAGALPRVPAMPSLVPAMPQMPPLPAPARAAWAAIASAGSSTGAAGWLLDMVAVAGIVVLLFPSQLVAFRRLMSRAGGSPLAEGRLLERVGALSSLWCIGTLYGLFANMTVRRQEVVIERSDDGGVTWEPYIFRYKPGRPGSDPEPVAWQAPVPLHLPRLDWRLWFVPLRSFSTPPWFLSLALALLEASPPVLALLAPCPATAPGRPPPQLVRASLWNYGFINPWKGWLRRGGEAGQGGAWQRSFARELLEPVSLADARRLCRGRAGGASDLPAAAGMRPEELLRAALREVLRQAVRQRRADAAAVAAAAAGPAVGLEVAGMPTGLETSSEEGDAQQEEGVEEGEESEGAELLDWVASMGSSVGVEESNSSSNGNGDTSSFGGDGYEEQEISSQ